MAISWGAWDYGSSSAGFRVGIEVTTSAVTSASASVTFTVKVYVEAMYNVDDEMTVTYGGNISGSSTQNLTTGSSGGTKLWGTLTHTYNYSTWGSSPGSRSFSGSLSGVYNGANPTKTVTVTIPARPYAKPAAPTSVVQTRNSDTQHTVTWVRNATASAPYTSLTVQRRVYSGSTWSAWATVATTTSTATSYVDKTVTANAGYQYQVKANNAAGSSAYVIPTAQYNTPAAPSNVAAVLSQTGTSIRVDWKNNHYTSSNVTYTIQRSVAGGGLRERRHRPRLGDDELDRQRARGGDEPIPGRRLSHRPADDVRLRRLEHCLDDRPPTGPDPPVPERDRRRLDPPPDPHLAAQPGRGPGRPVLLHHRVFQ